MRLRLSRSILDLISRRGRRVAWLVTAAALWAALAISVASAVWGQDVFVAPFLLVSGIAAFLLGFRAGAALAVLLPAVALLAAQPVFALPVFDSGAWARIVAFAPLGLLTAWLCEALARGVDDTVQVSDLRRELMSVAVHELSAPVTAIYGFAVAGERRAEDGALSATFDEIVHQSRVMRRTLDLFLNASRLDRGALGLHRESVDAHDVVGDAVEIARQLHPHVQYIAPPVGGHAVIATDAYMLGQVLLNLLDNAAKYAGSTPLVTVEVAAGPRATTITVSDNGPGIPDAERRLIFERFQRGSTARGPGSGLGLYIADRLTEAIGGSITVVEGPTPGACFRVDLPAASGPSLPGREHRQPNPGDARNRRGLAPSGLCQQASRCG